MYKVHPVSHPCVFVVSMLLLGLQVIDPFPLLTQKKKLKRHKHQKIEQGKGNNMILITPFELKMSKCRYSFAMSHIGKHE